ncbi:MAG: tRNA pseudouridine(38-40) synthase TruA [Lachnospiraceae bacterium]|nr:tRNA pseudouridine(38-40) synthase TruA [Lachnospiraceae bacterium]
MKRVLICVSYDGTSYSGWQYQNNARTIEGELNKALTNLHSEPIEVIGASRTDAGVHALSAMAVYDTNAGMPADKVAPALNTKLPDDIRIVWSKEVEADFHPRHRLTEKTYEYNIWNSEFMPPMVRNYYYHVEKELNLDRMNEAAAALIGKHDFKSYCSVHTTADTTVREITGICVYREGSQVMIKVSGYGFLYNMVRIIAGTLIDTGLGRREVSFAKDALEKCDRQAAGPTAPANGLVLKEFRFLE